MKNRVIKFRAWEFENNIMLDKHDKSDNSLNGVNFGLPPSFESVNTKYAWMQFTGLHDKNGKEIYEGDIYVWKKKLACEKGFIEYREDGFRCIVTQHSKSRGIDVWPLMSMSPYLEVIGNIYENPELLNPQI